MSALSTRVEATSTVLTVADEADKPVSPAVIVKVMTSPTPKLPEVGE